MATTPLDFSSIQGHQEHLSTPTIGPTPKASPMEVVNEITHIPEDPVGEIGKGLDTLRQKLVESEHPAAREVGQKLTDAKELLFGGQAAGKPMGTSGGTSDLAQDLGGVVGGEETLADAENLAREYGPKIAEHLAETGRNFLESGKAEVRSALHAHTPASRMSEAGRVPLNFDDIAGHKLEKAPEPPKNEQVAASAQRYNASRGQQAIDHSPKPLAPPEEKAALADAYDQARHEPTDPKVQKAYQAMKDETKAQFDHVTNDLGIKVDFTDKDPYTSAQDMQKDVRDNHHLSVFTGGEVPKDHPMAEVDPHTGQSYNNLFRATHDVFGHAAGGHDFSEAGENSAYGAHTQMYSPEAQPAVRTETQGQSNWFFNNREVRNGKAPGDFPEQKATILSENGKVQKNYDYETQSQAIQTIKENSPEWTIPKGEISAQTVGDQNLRHILLGDGSWISAEEPEHDNIYHAIGAQNVEDAKGIRVVGPDAYDISHRPTEQQRTEMARIIKEGGNHTVDWDLYPNGMSPITGAGSVGDFLRAIDSAFPEKSAISNNLDSNTGIHPALKALENQSPHSETPETNPAKDTVENMGLVYKGELTPGSGVHMIEHPNHPGMTAAVKGDITPETVGANMDRKLKEFGITPERPPHPDLQKVIDKFGTSGNGVGVRRGASFITPEGKFIHVQDHPAALKASGIVDAESNDARVKFGNDTRTVRMRFRPNTKAGDELSVTVPAQGATHEQAQGIKDAINSSMPRGTGNLVIERYDVNADNVNAFSKTIENVKPYMVDQALKDIHAHPDGDWAETASKMMTESPAGAIDPRTGKSDTDGFGVEIYPEARKAEKAFDHPPTPTEIQNFHAKNQELFDKHPELRIGWDRTDAGYELNIGAAAKNQAGAEMLGRRLDQRAVWDVANQKEIPTGGEGKKVRFGQSLEDRLHDLTGRNVAKLPTNVRESNHLTDDEKYLLGSNPTTLKEFKDTRKKIAPHRELAATAQAGEANRFWYDRAKKSFDTMFDSLPQGSFPEADRNRFIRLVAATSPRVDVTENVAAALNAYKAWVEDGRPENPKAVRAAIEPVLMLPTGHGGNATAALTDQEFSKNSPKVKSFAQNFMGSAKHVTNDMWGAITNGIVDPNDITKPGAYIALSENYRKAGELLGWTPQQAQAASWGFVRTLGYMSGWGAGKAKPIAEVAKLIDDDLVRQNSADIADIFLTSPKVRERLQSLGVKLEDFDGRLNKSIEQFGRSRGPGKLDTKHIARAAERVQQAKDFARGQIAKGKDVSGKAAPMLGSVLSGEDETP